MWLLSSAPLVTTKIILFVPNSPWRPLFRLFGYPKDSQPTLLLKFYYVGIVLYGIGHLMDGKLQEFGSAYFYSSIMVKV